MSNKESDSDTQSLAPSSIVTISASDNDDSEGDNTELDIDDDDDVTVRSLESDDDDFTSISLMQDEYLETESQISSIDDSLLKGLAINTKGDYNDKNDKNDDDDNSDAATEIADDLSVASFHSSDDALSDISKYRKLVNLKSKSKRSAESFAANLHSSKISTLDLNDLESATDVEEDVTENFTQRSEDSSLLNNLQDDMRSTSFFPMSDDTQHRQEKHHHRDDMSVVSLSASTKSQGSTSISSFKLALKNRLPNNRECASYRASSSGAVNPPSDFNTDGHKDKNIQNTGRDCDVIYEQVPHHNLNETEYRYLSIRQLCIYGLPKDTGNKDLTEYFSRWGYVNNCAIFYPPREITCMALITFLEASSVDLTQLARPHIVKDTGVTTRRHIPKLDFRRKEALVTTRRIAIRNIKPSTTEEQITNYFKQFGTVEMVALLPAERNDTSSCFVCFSEYDPVDKIVLVGRHIINGVQVDIKKVVFLKGHVNVERGKLRYMTDDNTVMLSDRDLKIMTQKQVSKQIKLQEQLSHLKDKDATRHYENYRLKNPDPIELMQRIQKTFDDEEASFREMEEVKRQNPWYQWPVFRDPSSDRRAAIPVTSTAKTLTSYQHYDQPSFNDQLLFDDNGWPENTMFLTCQLNVANLKYSTSEETLISYFSSWGEVKQGVILKDRNGASRGFGFINYTSAESVDKAQKWRPHYIDGQFVDTKRQIRKEDVGTPYACMNCSRVYVCFQDDVSQQDLNFYFQQFGSISHILHHKTSSMFRYNKRGYACITFDDPDVVDKAHLMKFHIVDGEIVHVKKSFTPGELAEHKVGCTNSANNSMCALIQAYRSFL